MRTANPALRAGTFDAALAAGGDAMTLAGTVWKAWGLLALLLLAASWSWSRPEIVLPFWWLWILGGLAVAVVTIFRKTAAPVTGPLYALIEGVILGALSMIFERQFPGVVLQAVVLTFGTLAALLLAYQSGWIRVTQNFRLGVVAATGGILVVYLVDLGLRFFGRSVPVIHEATGLGILFSLFVCAVAAMNLVLDFDFIEQGVERGAPKYMEWYAAFGLMVTLIWLYLEILRLLAKSRRR